MDVLQLARLPAAFQWDQVDAADRTREALRRELAALARELAEQATDAGVSLLTLLRNRIARAPYSELSAWRVVVAGLATMPGIDPAPYTALHSALASAGAGFSLAEHLIANLEPPPAAAIAPSLTGRNLAYALLLRAATSPPHTAAEAAARLAELALASKAEHAPLRDLPVLHIWRSESLPQLDRKSFAVLPGHLRRAILRDASSVEALLTPGLATVLSRHPLRDPDTPESVVLEEAALAAIVARDFRALPLGQWVRRRRPEEIAPLLSQALRETGEMTTSRPVAPTPSRLLQLLALLGPDDQPLLRFAAARPERRLRLLLTLSSEDRARVVATAPPFDWAWALLAVRAPRTLGAALPLLPAGTRRTQILERCREIEGSYGSALPLLPQLVLEMHDKARIYQELRARPEAFAPLLGGRAMHPALLGTIALLLSQLGGLAWLERTFGTELVLQLVQARPSEVKASLGSALAKPGADGKAANWAAQVARVLALMPDHLDGLLPAKLSVAQYQAVLRALPLPFSEHVRAWLLRATDARGGILWRQALEAHRGRAEEVPPALLAVIEEDTQALSAAAALYPAALAETAAARLPLEAALALAFSHAEVARAIERIYDSARLHAELPRLQVAWGDDPARAAAYEVALAFSLVDADYLHYLATVALKTSPERRQGHTFDHLYRTYQLPKQAGGNRTITVPDERLKRLQRRLLRRGFAAVPLPDAAHGFRPGRSILTNAQPHVGQELVVNVDIDSFFPSTPYPQIVRACAELRGGALSPRAHMFVADLCSYGGGLPTGAPTSPALANIILAPVDRALMTVCARYDLQYTRYADDLTFSGSGETKRIIPFVRTVLGDYGYALDEAKLNLYRRGRRQVVAGLVVNDKPDIPRRLRRRLRAAVHRRVQGETPTWHGAPMGDDELRGRIAYLNLVQPEEARRYREALRAEPAPPVDAGGAE